MIFFNFFDPFIAIFAFLLLGVFFGAIYNSMFMFFSFISKIIISPITAFDICRELTITKIKYASKIQGNIYKNTPFTNIADFIFFLLLGVFFIVIQYVFFDGVFRVFMLVSVFVFSHVSHLILGKFFNRFLGMIFEKLIFILQITILICL